MGSFHPDLQRSLDVAEAALYVGALLGGVIGSKEAVERFKDSNDATLFHGNRDALSQMSRKSLLGTALGALKVAPVLAVFAGGFTLFTSCVQAYRLEEGIFEYCVGGFMVGSLFRFHYGIKGMFIGGVVASLFGGIYGVAEMGLSKILGKDTTELKFLLASYKKEVADSVSPHNESDVSPSLTISEPVQNPSHSKTENKT